MTTPTQKLANHALTYWAEELLDLCACNPGDDRAKLIGEDLQLHAPAFWSDAELAGTDYAEVGRLVAASLHQAAVAV